MVAEAPGHHRLPATGTADGAPVKSVVIAELVRLLFDTWPESHPRTVVLVPSKELAEQNADKLMRILPSRRPCRLLQRQPGPQATGCRRDCRHHRQYRQERTSAGAISAASLSTKHTSLVPMALASIGSPWNDLARYCVFRVVGFTATPFRGNGVWLTDGDELIYRIAHETPVSSCCRLATYPR